MNKHDLIGSYRHLREILTAQHVAALCLVTETTLMERAKQIGMVQRREFACHSDTALQLLYDHAIHTAKPGKSRAIDRYAKIALPSCSPDESLVLAALVRATFSIWQVVRLHDVAGVILRDCIRGGEIWLMDVSIAATASPGMAFAGRTCRPGAFAMNTGVIVPVPADTVADVASEILPALGAAMGESAVDKVVNGMRLLTELYRSAIGTGLMANVRLVEPEDADRLSRFGRKAVSHIIATAP